MFKFIEDHGFMILGIASVVFIVLFSIIRLCSKKKGTWSNTLNHGIIPEPPRAPYEGGKESRGEGRTRKFLEEYFSLPFCKARPNFLRNNVTGGIHNLELDCFNADLKIAAEYNGRQHYEFVPFFHGTRETFLNQKYRDELKKIYCRDNGVQLIEIPYTVLPKLESWLKERLELLGLRRSEI